MRFAIRLLRHRGQIIPWREVLKSDPVFGDIRIEEGPDKELHRHRLTAKLIQDGSRGDWTPWPQLQDVRIVAMSGKGFTLTGIERLGTTEYAQNWWVVDAQT